MMFWFDDHHSSFKLAVSSLYLVVHASLNKCVQVVGGRRIQTIFSLSIWLVWPFRGRNRGTFLDAIDGPRQSK